MATGLSTYSHLGGRSKWTIPFLGAKARQGVDSYTCINDKNIAIVNMKHSYRITSIKFLCIKLYTHFGFKDAQPELHI